MKFKLSASIFQFVVGLLAVIMFFVLLFAGEVVKKWIVAFLLGIYFLISGIIGIKEYIKERIK